MDQQHFLQNNALLSKLRKKSFGLLLLYKLLFCETKKKKKEEEEEEEEEVRAEVFPKFIGAEILEKFRAHGIF